jgi:hypothetical protein
MKTTSNQFVDIYEKLFNLIFDTGIIPLFNNNLYHNATLQILSNAFSKSTNAQYIFEYMKTTSNQFVDIYEKLFNLIFDTGIIPESW